MWVEVVVKESSRGLIALCWSFGLAMVMGSGMEVQIMSGIGLDRKGGGGETQV